MHLLTFYKRIFTDFMPIKHILKLLTNAIVWNQLTKEMEQIWPYTKTEQRSASRGACAA